jgi:hypothetical protein
MSQRRALEDLLIDVSAGALAAASAVPGMTVRRMSVTLPVEIAAIRTREGIDLRGDVPRRLMRTVFDVRPSRLEVSWGTGGPR